MAFWVPWVIKGVAFGGSAVVASKLARKGDELLQRALAPDDEEQEPGDLGAVAADDEHEHDEHEHEHDEREPGEREPGELGAVADDDDDDDDERGGVLRAMGKSAQDWLSDLDFLDVFGTRRAKVEAQRKADIKAQVEREKKADKARKKEAKEADKARKAAEKADAARDDSLRAQLEASVKRLEDQIKAQAKAAKTAADKQAAAIKQANLRALQVARQAAAKPGAAEELKAVVANALQMVVQQGVVPDAQAYLPHGITPQSFAEPQGGGVYQDDDMGLSSMDFLT